METKVAALRCLRMTYNDAPMAGSSRAPKDGDKCALCGEGSLSVSSSGRNLVCPVCGRVALSVGLKRPSSGAWTRKRKLENRQNGGAKVKEP